ncbi:MAG: hypothetical protein KF691_02470 [Phycisphaeraceae bacterium]|nr:hypothetical protein [Phycisphaeraceae bacterium]
MNMYTYSWIIALFLFFAVLLMLELGRRIGKRRKREGMDPGKSGTGPVDAAVFGLLGLLIAFTFSGAASRFDARRIQIVDEANAIGTAYLRVDLLPPESQPPIRELFRQYTDQRIAVYQAIPDLQRVRQTLADSQKTQSQLWQLGVSAARSASSPAVTSLVIPAMNDMFDLANSRTAAGFMHVPSIVFIVLLGMAGASALLAGFGMATDKGPSLLHYVGFALVMSLVVLVILDLEFPRLGFITLEEFDQYIRQVRADMG